MGEFCLETICPIISGGDVTGAVLLLEKEEKKNQKHPKEKAKRTSKFSSKYSDRIASIREADEMIKLKEEKIKKKERVKNKAKGKTKATTVASKKANKTPQEIRNEMLKTLKDSKLK